jgi:dTDP-4-amino-4,6-dideoxygalactose transaminase
VYLRELAKIPGLTLPVRPAEGETSVWHLFCVRHPRRDALAAHLAAAGIGNQIHYPEPPHRSAAFADLGFGAGSFPVTETAADTLLSLPIGPHLSVPESSQVIDAMRAFCAG